MDRRLDSDLTAEGATTTQTEFGVEVPNDSASGTIEIKCYTYGDDARTSGRLTNWVEIWEVFRVWITDGQASLNWKWSDYNKGRY